MSYISPIKIGKISQMEEGWADKIGKYIDGEVDNLVLESCVKVGCHVDKDELEKALRYDRGQYIKGYEDGKRDAASPWHRVEDGLPKEPGEYIVAYHPCYWEDVDTSVTKVGIDNFRGKSAWAKKKFQRVMHWMEKPEPPKEDA